MSLNLALEAAGGIARITLDGELDAAVADRFKQAVETAAAGNPSRLVLHMEKLSFMASAGLRILIFAKQKMGEDVGIYVVGAQEPVLRTIEMSGFQHSVYLQDSYTD
jgi:anti-anti-sigma factor